MAHPDSFGARSTLSVGGRELEVFRLGALQPRYDVARLPYTLRVLLENVLRREDGVTVTARDVEAVASWNASAAPATRSTSTRPASSCRTSPACRPSSTSPRCAPRWPTSAATRSRSTRSSRSSSSSTTRSRSTTSPRGFAIARNSELEFERNRERYAFLRWGQGASPTSRPSLPNTGICHQVNLEFLARVVEERDGQAFPDTVVGTDSHTTMINGLGVLGWGVGGIEAEAAMLGEAISMLVPQVVGFRLHGALPKGSTATDLVLTVTQILRQTGVVGKFVEYFGHGLAHPPARRPRDDREHVPGVRRDVRLLPRRRRDAALPARSPAAARRRSRSSRRTAGRTASGTTRTSPPTYSQVVELDLSSVEPSLAGPRRPQDRVPLHEARNAFLQALPSFGVSKDNGAIDEAVEESMDASDPPAFDGHQQRTSRPTRASMARRSRSTTAPS